MIFFVKGFTRRYRLREQGLPAIMTKCVPFLAVISSQRIFAPSAYSDDIIPFPDFWALGWWLVIICFVVFLAGLNSLYDLIQFTFIHSEHLHCFLKRQGSGFGSSMVGPYSISLEKFLVTQKNRGLWNQKIYKCGRVFGLCGTRECQTCYDSASQLSGGA